MDDKVKELLDRIRDTAAGAADAANQTAPGSREKGGPDGGCGQAECAAV